jgi:hypothetical protein
LAYFCESIKTYTIYSVGFQKGWYSLKESPELRLKKKFNPFIKKVKLNKQSKKSSGQSKNNGS